MKQLLQEVKWFLGHRLYVAAIVLTAVCSYGFAIVQPSIGIDDTATELYFTDGLAVVMGRWTLFLLNKIFNLAQFAPFVTELAGVILLMLGTLLFCVLLKRIFGERVGIAGYVIFSCVFLSNPIMSEVYIYYLHNGVSLGYVLTALGLILFLEAMDQRRRKKVLSLLKSMLLLWIAAGCYESFLLLYVLGILVIVFLRGLTWKNKMSGGFVFASLGLGGLVCIGCIVLRTITIPLLTQVFGLQELVGVMELRSLSEMLVLFQGREGLETLFMLAKRFWLVYHVNALVYLPVTGYVLANCCVGAACAALCIKRKNLWYPILFIGMLAAPFLLTVAETKIAYYRSCQYLPFATAFGVLLLFEAFREKKAGKIWKPLVAVFVFVLVFNQASMMNKSFYTDYKKYESDKEILNTIAYEVERQYGKNAVVVFTGHYDTPQVFLEDYYAGYDSWQYRMIAAITDLVDVHLKEKYFSPYGYSFVGEAANPLIQWGLDAFDGTNRQLINFMKMHGHSFETITEPAVLKEAEKIGESMPHWPEEGSIAKQDGYILVHF